MGAIEKIVELVWNTNVTSGNGTQNLKNKN